MKKIIIFLVLIGMVTLLFVGAYAQPKPTPIKVTLASYSPPGAHKEAVEGWVKELEQRSGGRLKIEFAWGSVMAKPAEHYDLAVNGIAEIALVGLPYTPGRFPLVDVVELPLAKMSDTTLVRACWELYQKGYFDQDFKDVKLLLLWTSGPYQYMMGKTPVRNFADMKGKKIRASGTVAVNVVKALGSIPVGLPAPEIYAALDKGTIDGTLSSWSFMKAYKTHEVSKYVTDISTTYLPFALVMNKAFFKKLPEDIKKIIDDIGLKYSLVGGETQDQWQKEAQGLFKQVGGETIGFSPSDLESVRKALFPLWADWIADGEKKGLPRKKMVDDLYFTLKKMGVENPYHGYVPGN
ncbi:MAG: hypothetical protein A2169_02305 [Deltaproteobacteria bacterium RBG_13_47_9]|nr:MAG: hypothetical protein A2169_02305 [Deltaproteobacteria bacterium RBG_13_47_9]